MSKVIDYRYVSSKGEHEKQINVHVKEMIEMIKNEQVKDNLYVKAVKLSAHALERMEQYFGVSGLATVTKVAKDMLKHAVRIGSVLAFDGRINVLYAYQQTGFYLSPDLKTLVTVGKYHDVTFKGLIGKASDGTDTEVLSNMHFEFLREIEIEENDRMSKILSIEKKVKEATDQCSTMLTLVKGGGRKKAIKELISDQNLQLKIEGRKLFELKVKKRHLCKSLIALC